MTFSGALLRPTTGAQKGCVMGSLLFCLVAVQPVLERLRQSADLVRVAIVDDSKFVMMDVLSVEGFSRR